MEELKKEAIEKIAKIAEFYGIHDQTVKTIEVLAELQHALCRELLNTNTYSLKGEMANVWAMMQFLFIHYFDEEEVIELATLKAERLFHQLNLK